MDVGGGSVGFPENKPETRKMNVCERIEEITAIIIIMILFTFPRSLLASFLLRHAVRSSPKRYDVLMLFTVIYLSVYGSSELMGRGISGESIIKWD